MADNNPKVNKPARVTSAYPEDLLRNAMFKNISPPAETLASYPFHFAQVTEVDETNGRIKARIPLIDRDITDDNDLPWCLPTSNRFIELPEVNSVVILGTFNTLNTNIIRFWFAAINEKATKDLFDATRLVEEFDKNKEVWDNLSNVSNITYGWLPGQQGRGYTDAKIKKINYKVGIRGKGKNYLLFDKDITTLVQNKGASNESKLELTDKAALNAKNIDLLSTSSKKEHRPVFADPLFSHLDKINTMLKTIMTILSTTPGYYYGVLPCTPNAMSSQLTGQYAQLTVGLNQLKQPDGGKSKYIKIN